MRKDIILCGVGGQGTVLASKLLCAAAMAKGLPVMSAETIGMAQRGGSVFSHLRLGEGVYSPMIALGSADLILGFEPGEAVRQLPSLKPDGRVVVSSRPVMPVTASLTGGHYDVEEMLRCLRANVDRFTVVDAEKAMAELGSSRILNLLLLGAALRDGALGLTEEDLQSAIYEKIPEKYRELNLRALSYYKKTVG